MASTRTRASKGIRGVCILGLASLVSSSPAEAGDPIGELIADARPAASALPTPVSFGLKCPVGTGPFVVYESNFDADDDGWVEGGFGEWERGPIVPTVFEICDTAPRPEPAAAPTGVNVWGTNLNGCYANANSLSTLTRSFDFTELEAPIALEWSNWYEIFVTFDTATVFVEDAQVFGVATTTATPAFQTEQVDLSGQAGNADVDVEFRLFATTVVNRMGWYVDDVRILICSNEIFLDGFETGDTVRWSSTVL